ncbi:hypothetical protein BD410DRAFT_791938 [Rickenella mellea]|uniref:F-box domain-containing protein n=1 Tax=Rickenella mellea TaxID=50990 RepID=A0A4Y7PYD6_9AGAM|nr:hypothetical protein BD410DRAFT_791938 [Rickenella mellea]
MDSGQPCMLEMETGRSGFHKPVDTCQHVLGRSGTAPLKLWIILTASAPDQENEAINLAISHIFHACELHISVNSPADCLQDIWRKLQFAKCSQRLTTISFRSTYKCPHLLFRNIPRGVRVLETTMIDVLNQTVLLRQLTHLKIHNPDYSEITPSDMLVILGCCVELIDFEFHHYGSASAPIPGTASVTFPFLRHLSLSGGRTCTDLLCHLKFPPGVSLTLKSSISFPQMRVPPELYYQYDSCELHISMSDICVTSQTSTVKGQSTMDVKFGHSVNDTALMHGLGILQFSFPSLLVQLKTITIALSPLTSSTTGFRWEELLRKLPNLSALVLRGEAPGRRGFAGPLAKALSRPNEIMQPFCPNLRTLTVENFDLYPITAQRSLVKFVASRDEMGARLGMLDISRCTELEPIIFDELAPFVDEVVRPSPSAPLQMSHCGVV